MIYRFEIEVGAGDWLAVGTGKGAGVDPVEAAFDDLASDADRPLGAGRYRFVPAGASAEWRYLSRGEDGSVLIDS